MAYVPPIKPIKKKQRMATTITPFKDFSELSVSNAEIILFTKAYTIVYLGHEIPEVHNLESRTFICARLPSGRDIWYYTEFLRVHRLTDEVLPKWIQAWLLLSPNPNHEQTQ